MFFYASKIIWFFLTPSNALAGLILLGAVMLFTQVFRIGRALVLAGVVGLALFGLSPLPNALMLSLEDRFSVPVLEDIGPVDTIIVLGGAVDAARGTARGTVEVNEAAERLLAVPVLARQFEDARIVLSGGAAAILVSSSPEADQMAHLLQDLGIQTDRLVREDRSRNTAQNARFSYELIKPAPGSRHILITSAFHMPRAVATFQKAGWPGIIPYPVDFRTRGPADLTRPYAALGKGIRRSDMAVREWLGLVAYRLSGRTGVLLSKPDG